jgi:hypothetical protein
MKKLILSLSFVAAAFAVSAQGIQSPVRIANDNMGRYTTVKMPAHHFNTPALNKSQSVSTWYNYATSLNDEYGGVNTTGLYAPYLFRDTNIVYLGSTNGTFDKLDTFVWNSVGASFDPTAEVFANDNDTTTVALPGSSLIPKTAYTWDSLGFFYTYQRGIENFNGQDVVDTLYVQLFNTYGTAASGKIAEYDFYRNGNKSDTSSRFTTVAYNTVTGMATKADKVIKVPLTLADTSVSTLRFRSLAVGLQSANGAPVVAVLTYVPSVPYNSYDTLVSTLDTPKIAHPVNSFRFLMNYDANKTDLMTFNNGLVIQNQQRGKTKWWVDPSGTTPALYWPGTLFTNSYYYPDLFFHITATYTPAGINEFSNIGTEVKMYPNPATSTTTIGYTLTKAANVIVSVKDITGKEIMTINQGYASAGMQKADLNTSSLKSGVYFVNLNAGGATRTLKLVIAQ